MDDEEAFYGGAVGGGKTAALLMAALQYVDTPGYAALILRRTFPELDQPGNLVWISKEWFAQAPESQRPSYLEGKHLWTFPSGAVIRFGHLDSVGAEIVYQGGGYHFIGFDELTHFEENSYEFIGFSRQRRPPDGPLSEIPIRVRATANPGGPGHAWVKRRFVTERKDDVTFVPAKVWDNPGIDTDDYVKRLEKLSPVLREQLLNGDWSAFEGAAFEKFREDIHCVERFPIPLPWERFESMDYGISAPTAWLAWAVDYDGNHLIYDCFHRPAMPSESAPIILENRKVWLSDRCYGDPQSLAAPTHKPGRDGIKASISTEFLDHGISIIPANNNTLSGYVRLRELIEPDPDRRFPDWHPKRGDPGSPRLFIVKERCPDLVEQFLTAPLQPIEDRFGGERIDVNWERRTGHAMAAARYGAMSRPSPSDAPMVLPSDPRTIWLYEYEKKMDGGGSRPVLLDV